jgi:hypothetical protein
MRISWEGGRFRNTEEGKGWLCAEIPHRRGMYRIQLPDNPADRLTYVTARGWWVQTRQTFESDFASVPCGAQWIVGPREYELFALFHDDACLTDQLQLSRDMGATWEAVYMPRSERDRAAYHGWLPAENASWLDRKRIYFWLRVYAYGTGQWE